MNLDHLYHSYMLAYVRLVLAKSGRRRSLRNGLIAITDRTDTAMQIMQEAMARRWLKTACF